jgi:hypothetical protein
VRDLRSKYVTPRQFRYRSASPKADNRIDTPSEPFWRHRRLTDQHFFEQAVDTRKI